MATPPSSSPATRRVAVVGGGITGLSAAHRLVELFRDAKRPFELTLFEADSRLGGVIGTRTMDGYLVETGADMFITNKPWAVDLCRRLGLADRLIPTDDTYRRSLVLKNGKPLPVPAGFMLLAPDKIWPVLKSPIFSLRGKLRMGLEYCLPARRDNGDESLASFVRRRFGNEVLERLVQPLVGGIYTSDPEKLSLKATMPRFLDMERECGSLIRASKRQARQKHNAENEGSGARYGLFASLPGGMSELLDALEQRIAESATIRLNTTVSRVSRRSDADGFKLIFDDGSRQEFDAVLLTVPAYRAGEMISELDRRLAESLQEIEYASTAIVVSGHKLSDIRDPLDAFGLVIPAIEKRQILAVSYTSRKFPGRAPDGHILLRTFVGGAMQPELLDRSDEELLALVRREQEEILGVGGHADFAFVARYTRAMPQYHVGHVERVEAIERRSNGIPGLELAGNAYRGVGIPDCIHSAEQAAARLVDG